MTVGHELTSLLERAGKSLVVDLCLESAVEDVLCVERQNVVKGCFLGDETFLVERSKKIVFLSHTVSFGCVDHTDQAHGLSSMATELRLGLPNLSHVLQAVICLDKMLFFDSCLLPRMWRRIEFWSGKLWLTHLTSPHTFFRLTPRVRPPRPLLRPRCPRTLLPLAWRTPR